MVLIKGVPLHIYIDRRQLVNAKSSVDTDTYTYMYMYIQSMVAQCAQSMCAQQPASYMVGVSESE